MPIYAYEAFDKTGSVVKGRLEATDEMAVADRLAKQSLLVVNITEKKGLLLQSLFAQNLSKKSSLKNSLQNLFDSYNSVKTSDLAIFSRQLATMLAAGIPLIRCLSILRQQTGSSRLGTIVESVAEHVEQGESLSRSLQEYPKVFSPMYINMVKAGEISGALEEIFMRLAEYLERSKTLGDNVRSALLYPAMVISFAIIVSVFMLLFIVPVFINLFPPDIPLPLLTQIVVFLSESLHNYWYVYLSVLIIVLLSLSIAQKKGGLSIFWDKVKYKLPLVGNIFKKSAVAGFARTLSTLLAVNIPILQALSTAGSATGSRQVMDIVDLTGIGLQEGQSMATMLESSTFFPLMLIHMAAVGEETGELPLLLSKAADFYETEVSAATKGLTSLLEPVLLIVIGFIVGVMVISLYLPMFTTITTIGN